MVTLLGFGAYTILPFYPEFIEKNGRLAWYYLVCATVVGQLGYGVVWSLGDACAANVAHKTGQSFGQIRLWGTVGWGVAGALVGSIGPHLPQLPEMVLGLLVFVISHVFEIIMLCCWSNSRANFEMGDQAQKQTFGSNEKKEKGEIVFTSEHCVQSRLAKNVIVSQEMEPTRRKRISQWTIFKLVALRDKSIFKYLLIFTVIGALFNIHFSYFFLHLEKIAATQSELASGVDFSTLVGMCVVAQAIGETFCFVIAPWVISKLGRDGAISLNLVAYIFRYLGNGLGIALWSPFVAVLTESLQGINYGIFYFLITDTALHYALQVDHVIPQIIQTHGANIDLSELVALRTSLRATMQGVFSGAFDGLGFGLGSIVAGSMLERYSYEQLWCQTALAAFVMFVLHTIYELARRQLLKKAPSIQKTSRIGHKSIQVELDRALRKLDKI